MKKFIFFGSLTAILATVHFLHQNISTIVKILI